MKITADLRHHFHSYHTVIMKTTTYYAEPKKKHTSSGFPFSNRARPHTSPLLFTCGQWVRSSPGSKTYTPHSGQPWRRKKEQPAAFWSFLSTRRRSFGNLLSPVYLANNCMIWRRVVLVQLTLLCNLRRSTPKCSAFSHCTGPPCSLALAWHRKQKTKTKKT